MNLKPLMLTAIFNIFCFVGLIAQEHSTINVQEHRAISKERKIPYWQDVNVVKVNKAPLPGETILTNNYTKVPGGKGGNKAYALGKLGASVAMVGAVGNDDAGDALIANLKKVKVIQY